MLFVPLILFFAYLFTFSANAIRISNEDDDALLSVSLLVSRLSLTTFIEEQYPYWDISPITSIDYVSDNETNCIFWASNFENTIAKQCYHNESDITGTQSVLFRVTDGNIGHIAYDWTSKLLYFTKRQQSRIEAIATSIDSMVFHRTIVQLSDGYKPSSIAVHPGRGYLFWASDKLKTLRIERANLDGSDVRTLYESSDALTAESLAIDYEMDRVYWTNHATKMIAGCDFDGENFVEHVEDVVASALAIYNDSVYWVDTVGDALMTAQILERDNVTYDNFTFVVEPVKVILKQKYFSRKFSLVSQSVRSIGNTCSDDSDCSHVCVGAPYGGRVCLCPDGMEMTSSGQCYCPGSQSPPDSGPCPPIEHTCGDGEFQCTNHECVPDFLRCDSDDDCTDGSDQADCAPCPPHMHRCEWDGRCIPE